MTRVDQLRARQAASGAAVHPETARFAARLAARLRRSGDTAARSATVPVAGAVGPGTPGSGVTGPGAVRPAVIGTTGLTAVGPVPAVPGSTASAVVRPGPVAPAPVPALAGPMATDATVELARAAAAPPAPITAPSWCCRVCG